MSNERIAIDSLRVEWAGPPARARILVSSLNDPVAFTSILIKEAIPMIAVIRRARGGRSVFSRLREFGQQYGEWACDTAEKHAMSVDFEACTKPANDLGPGPERERPVHLVAARAIGHSEIPDKSQVRTMRHPVESSCTYR